jgi:hypothetical protein
MTHNHMCVVLTCLLYSCCIRSSCQGCEYSDERMGHVSRCMHAGSFWLNPPLPMDLDGNWINPPSSPYGKSWVAIDVDVER